MTDRYEHQVIEEEIPDNNAVEKYRQRYRITNVVWTILIILETLLAFRFALRLLDANPANAFADFIYGLSGVFLAPFFGLFDEPVFDGNVFEWSTLVAMFAYLILAWIIVKVVDIIIVPTEMRQGGTALRRQH